MCVLKAIPNMEVTDGGVHDSTQLTALLDSLPLDDIEAVTADAGYLSRRNCDLIEAKGAKPHIKIKKNIHVIRAWGSRAWVNMILEWRKDPKAWNRKYHMRSSVKSAFSAIKRKFGHILASIRKDLQRKELMAKVLAYNINILCRIN
jgi:transposase